MDRFVLRKHTFFVKRDDLIDPLLSGNKYRKFYHLLNTPANQYRRITSYGGIQSNAMLSLAALCQQKEWEFHYTSRPVPDHIKYQPTGNLKAALALGMQLHEVSHEDYADVVSNLASQADAHTLYIPQGGADPMAQHGIQILAQEINQWQQDQRITKLNIVTPSGTGTTAFYLAKALPNSVLYTTAVVGDQAYLLSQINKLGATPVNLNILKPIKKYHFAKPYLEFLAMHHELIEAGITFDLIYGAPMWHTLLQHINTIEGSILYIHSGGLIGNATMLARYRHAVNKTPTR